MNQRIARLENALQEIERILGFDIDDETEPIANISLSASEALALRRLIREALDGESRG